MARPWSPERRVVLIDLDGKNRIEVMRDRFLLDEPGALQWHELDTLWMIGTPANPFGGMSFASGRILHSYDLRTRQHKTLAASPVKIGRESCRERGCQSVEISGVAVSLKKKYQKEKKT